MSPYSRKGGPKKSRRARGTVARIRMLADGGGGRTSDMFAAVVAFNAFSLLSFLSLSLSLSLLSSGNPHHTKTYPETEPRPRWPWFCFFYAGKEWLGGTPRKRSEKAKRRTCGRSFSLSTFLVFDAIASVEPSPGGGFC